MHLFTCLLISKEPSLSISDEINLKESALFFTSQYREFCEIFLPKSEILPYSEKLPNFGSSTDCS